LWDWKCRYKKGIPNVYLPDIKTASYCPRLAAITRCFNLLRVGRTSNAGGSAKKHIFDANWNYQERQKD
jgi:hypothetical protein